MGNTGVKTAAKISLLAVIAAILMLFEFPLWFAPAFYQIDLSEVAVLIGGFALGPLAAAAIEFLKVAINLLFKPSITFCVGETANFLIGCAFVLPASIIYKRGKTLKRAIFGMLAGIVSMAAVGAVINAFVLVPTYAYAFGMESTAPLIGMGGAINPYITDMFTFALFAVAPFNVFKGIVTMIITLPLYKRISPLLHK